MNPQSPGHLLPPGIILAGRRTNDGMGPYVGSELVKAMIKAGHAIANARVLVMGFTFKENCPDLRNTRVIDVVKELQDFGCQLDVADSWAGSAEAEHENGISLTEKPEPGSYNGVLVAVPHKEYTAMSARAAGGLFDLKGMLPLGGADLRL